MDKQWIHLQQRPVLDSIRYLKESVIDSGGTPKFLFVNPKNKKLPEELSNISGTKVPLEGIKTIDDLEVILDPECPVDFIYVMEDFPKGGDAR